MVKVSNRICLFLSMLQTVERPDFVTLMFSAVLMLTLHVNKTPNYDLLLTIFWALSVVALLDIPWCVFNFLVFWFI